MLVLHFDVPVPSRPEGCRGTDPPVEADVSRDGSKEEVSLRPDDSVQPQPREPQVS